MKYVFPALLSLTLSVTACAQDKGEVIVPEPVKAAFAKQFPKAEGAKWEMEDKTDYEAEFKMNVSKYSAKFDAKGTWIETEHKIKQEELPAPVQQALKSNYADHKVEGAEVAETPEGTIYEVALEKADHEMEVVFNAAGKVLNTKVEEDDKN